MWERRIRAGVRILLVLAVLTGLAAAGRGAIPEAERQVLIDLYLATGGDAWTHNDNWRLPGDPGQFNLPGTESTWYGVTTDAENTTVVKLNLHWNGLSGPLPESVSGLLSLQELDLSTNRLASAIPASLGALTSLHVLNLMSNRFTGTIPEPLGSLPQLKTLYLGGNQLTSAIPESLGNLSQLEYLSLRSNQLTGTIPASLGQLSRLYSLNLSGNRLTGEIPEPLSTLSELHWLNLSGNQFSGPLPAWLGNLAQLEILLLDNNLFSGPIPDSFRNLANLETLYLVGNWGLDGALPAGLGDLSQLISLSISRTSIGGSIPPELGRLNLLQYLDLHGNALSGEIPPALGGLTALKSLDLSTNQLTGPLPETFGDLTNLNSLNLSGNWLTGPIPDSWAGLTALRHLYLYRNQLSGPLPAWLGGLQELVSLDLCVNNFSGPIPESLGDLSQLATLQLHSNLLSGSIPASLGSLPALVQLHLGWNALEGAIPASLGNLVELSYLNVSYCSLSGSIPESLGNLSHLRELYLYENQLSGSVPPSFGNLSELQKLSLAGNQLSGPMPEFLGNLVNLEYLGLGGNLFQGTIPETWGALPALQGLYLDGNQLSGPIPDFLGEMTSLRNLSLSENQFSGPIPASLGNLHQLERLYLGWNQLSGPIPPALWNLPAVIYLWLERNQLSGPIPSFSNDMPSLVWLNLSWNQLSGGIPPSLVNLSKLRVLDLDGNQFEGPLPEFLADIPTLYWLDLESNQLMGSIPEEIMDLPALDWIHLGYNALHADSPVLADYINWRHYHGVWPGYNYRDYQTLPPVSLAATEVQPGAVRLTWTPDPDPDHSYAGIGGYEVWQRQGTYGAWKLRDVIIDKHSNTWTGSLAPGEVNIFRLRTYTSPQTWNQNRVASEFTLPLSVNPPGGGQAVTVYVDDGRHGDIYGDSPSQVAPASPITVRIDPSAFAGASYSTPHVLWIALPPNAVLSQTLATGNPASAAPLPLAGERVLDLAVVEYRVGAGGLPEPMEGDPLASIGPHAVQLLRCVAGEKVIQVRIVESSAQWIPRNGGDFVGFTLGLAAGAWPSTGASNWGPDGIGTQASTLLCLDLRESSLAADGEFRVTLYGTKQPGEQLLPLTFAGSGYRLFTVGEVLTGEIPFTFALGTPIEDFDTADVDGDGVDDLVAITPGESRVYWSLGQRGGGFAGIHWVDLPVVPTRVDLADVDGDSRPDVLTADDAGTLHVYLWDSLFGPQKTNTKAPSPDRSFRLSGLVTDARVCDVTGDGQKDYLFCDAAGGRVHVLAGPAFSADQSYAAGTEPSALTAGDFNGDGAPDLAAANAGSFSVSVFWNDGAGHFTASTLPDIGVRPVDLDAGDFNRDGRADLAVALAGEKAIGIVLAQPGNQFNLAQEQKIFFQSTPSAVLADNFDGEAGADALVGFADSSKLALCVSDAGGALQHRYSIDTLGDAALDSSGQTATLAADQVLSVAGGTSLGGVASRQGAAVIASLGVNLIHFPRSRDLSFSVVNLGEADALVNLELYADAGGAPLATATDSIPAGAQYARYLSGVLGSAADQPGRWVRAFLTAPATYGIWLANDPALTYLDGTRMPDARDAKSRLLFPVVRTGGGNATTIELINPLRLPANLGLAVYGPTGAVKSSQAAVLAGRGRLELDAAARFPGITEDDSIVVTVERGIVGLELFGGASSVACLEAIESDSTGAVLYAPHVATGDFGVAYQSVLTLVNTSESSLTVELALFTDGGELGPGSPITRNIPARGKLEEEVAGLFGLSDAFTGYLAADPHGASGLAGSLTFGETGAGRFLSALPLAPQAHNRFLLGHIANGRIGNIDFFTGLAVLNPDLVHPARIQVTAFDTQGRPLDSRQIILQAYDPEECPDCVIRKVFLLDDLMPGLTDIFGGYILIENQENSAGVLVFELFGDWGLNVLSAVPAVPLRD